ncbi:NifB/NifX family molybdenum-iron cluster-binding protein [Seleniivibrio woodruffii]|uniref:Putative Fe-Mo cluster-binding NifX family protein n=1 Tax=Seleniivibrio woodruffii TaxID=1078050 RepID=A0A4V6NEF1_9BACT|nr:hypothetical protein [Seleniivibrio woodruffii]TCK59891.1 putative Fe-Mo cluster-binding NifX family protein [Seleniivibrio woodruffii]TVZ35888.1 putative Fe-Mo cluster-binding NifX family protein [Seleniivibrio woodruffii]
MKKLLIIMLSVFVSTAAFAAGSPYLAAAANGSKPSSAMSNTPGKAPFFILFDDKGAYIESIPNPYAGEEGAGPMAIGMLKDKGVKIFAAESFPGERFKGFLSSKGMTSAVFKGSAEAAAKSIIKKK